MNAYLEFEDQIAELDNRLAGFRAMSDPDGGDEMRLDDQISALEDKRSALLKTLYRKLDPWQKAQVARHPQRPHFTDYLTGLFTEFCACAGDRKFAEDHAMAGGLARLNGRPVVVIGQEKGNDTQSRLHYNFGMARPEGYRKAVRLMELGERFSLPVITLVDTAGAYPGVGAEERGQAEAIARCTECCLNLRVPVVTVIIGEGGSGGAVAIATANSVLMLEHAIYSVISPEGAASILWRDSARAKDAAKAMKITAQDLLRLSVIDSIIEEPTGGAHRGVLQTIEAVGKAIDAALTPLLEMAPDEVRRHRREKFLNIGRHL